MLARILSFRYIGDTVFRSIEPHVGYPIKPRTICELLTDESPPPHRIYGLTTTARYCFLLWQHICGDRLPRIDEVPLGKNALRDQNEERHLRRSRDPCVLMRFRDRSGTLATDNTFQLYG